MIQQYQQQAQRPFALEKPATTTMSGFKNNANAFALRTLAQLEQSVEMIVTVFRSLMRLGTLATIAKWKIKKYLPLQLQQKL
jgi:hypothetical protein